MRSGLYAIASLDGAPLDARELKALGFAETQCSSGFAVQVVDREEGGRAAHVLERPDETVALLGYLDEPGELAATLGMAADAVPAALAGAALERFGAEAPQRMLGEWSLLRWHAPARELTVLASEALRDPLYFACDGKRVAIAAEPAMLARLSWVGAALDPAGMALYLSRARLRRLMTDETAWRGITCVMPGTRETSRPGRGKTRRMAPRRQPEPWRGGFDDAVEAIEAALRRIVRQQLGRTGTAALLLSGGLDSSLLAWLASQERGAGQKLFLLTSVAPEASGLADERALARSVADHLDLPIEFLTPPPQPSLYAPSARVFAHTQSPVASPRHYLYDALYDAAAAQGARVLLDGLYGELTISNQLPLAESKSAVQRLREMRAWLGTLRGAEAWPHGAFHARLSKEALDALPAGWRAAWRRPYDFDPWPRGDAPWGFRDAIAKSATIPTSSPGALLRHPIVYRDVRLLRLVASMPGAFLHQDGQTRALSRAVMKGRVPDAVRLRLTRGQISPDYDVRIRAQAPEVLPRLEAFRAAGADSWLDLGWLEAAVRRIAAGHTQEAFDAQATAIAAEFLVWWKDQTGANAS